MVVLGGVLSAQMVSCAWVTLVHLGEDQQQDGTARGAQYARLLRTTKANAHSAGDDDCPHFPL